MKSVVKYAGLFFLFICTILISVDIQTQTERRSELEDALALSMRNTLKASTFTPMYEMSESDMRIEFIRNFAENINGDGTFTIAVQRTSRLGLLDVKVQETFAHNNGREGQMNLQRTLLVEEYKK